MSAPEPPVALLAELTHRCPLHCPYCSNPLETVKAAAELPTADWLRVLEEAAALGVLHVHFSGGEPLLRPDLRDLVRHASHLGLYTNLITSGVGLDAGRVARLCEAGLGAVQLSFQAATPGLADRLAGARAFAAKLEAARAVREAGLPLGLNVVLHALNLHEVDAIIRLAEELGAERLELANCQYYGWALANRDLLLPDRDALVEAEAVVEAHRRRLGERMEILWVIPDYYESYPKPCMGGWGRRQLTVAPDGTVLPCPVASVIPGLPLHTIRDRSLRWIWYESETMNRFRGTDWMAEPCRSCDRRLVDFGGCRCQAYLLTGDPAAPDPVCHLAPHHGVVAAARRKAVAVVAPVTRHARPAAGAEPARGLPGAGAASRTPGSFASLRYRR